MRIHNLSIAAVIALTWPGMAFPFEGRIHATITRGSQTNALLYTVRSNALSIEITGSTGAQPINIVDMDSGAVTLVFPHNQTFVRLKGGTNSLPVPPSRESSRQSGRLSHSGPELPAGIGPQTPSTVPTPAGIGPTNLPGTPARRPLPAMPQPPTGSPAGIGPQPGGASAGIAAMRSRPMMPMPAEKLELKATGETTNLVGYACARYEFEQRGATLEIWATDNLFPFQAYQKNQPSRVGPRTIEEQWPALLTERKLFPILVSLRYDSGTERFRFEVKSVMEEKVNDAEGKLFQPPPDYYELEPLPF